MFTEADLLPISALQHLIYCPRQCALIHNEQLWVENRLTVEGQQLHAKAHDDTLREHRPHPRKSGGVRTTRGLQLRSFTHGLRGVADVVEFADDPGVPPLPIEYKRGKPKKHDADKIQLCAQALCLEEMLGLMPITIERGELYYGKTRRRQEITFDQTLRDKTTQAATSLRELLDSGRTPPARYDKDKCDRCSLIALCMPGALRVRESTADRFHDLLTAAMEAT